MNSAQSVTIPALPCEAFDDTLAFWEALGFECSYRQRAPNPYAVMRARDYELHFFGLKALKPQDNFSTCLVIVPEVEALHRQFSERLRAHLGRVPVKGFPRLSRMRPGQSRFTLTDVAGNSVIFIRRGGEDAAAAEAYRQPDLTPLQRAIHAAARLRDFKGDDAAAARTLDVALSRLEQEAPLDIARALAARLELATVLDDPRAVQARKAELQNLPLTEAERQVLAGQGLGGALP